MKYIIPNDKQEEVRALLEKFNADMEKVTGNEMLLAVSIFNVDPEEGVRYGLVAPKSMPLDLLSKIMMTTTNMVVQGSQMAQAPASPTVQ